MHSVSGLRGVTHELLAIYVSGDRTATLAPCHDARSGNAQRGTVRNFGSTADLLQLLGVTTPLPRATPRMMEGVTYVTLRGVSPPSRAGRFR